MQRKKSEEETDQCSVFLFFNLDIKTKANMYIFDLVAS